MVSEGRCPRCGSALPEGEAARGGCRRCLLALGLGAPGSSEESEPERVGSFRIVDTLARGATSVTCRAEDEDGRAFALRLLDAPEDAPTIEDRLKTLRERFTRVSHPGVVTDMEVGRTRDGRPWLATEWVAGVPITELCDRERLSLRRRLEVMVETCAAVEAAHAAGLVHLDLRPSRVLVTVEDDGPRPRVLDWGVAEALGTRLTEAVLFSVGGVAGEALAYSAPDRLDPRGGEPDVRSDVYALGAMTYELLVGVPPFETRRLRRARWAEIRRIIREEAPPRPSARVAAHSADLSVPAAARRQTDPASWGRDLRGDLDWIVLKSLEKDPSARYPSAGALRRDIERHLRGERVAPGWRSVGRRLRQLFSRAARRGGRGG